MNQIDQGNNIYNNHCKIIEIIIKFVNRIYKLLLILLQNMKILTCQHNFLWFAFSAKVIFYNFKTL